MWERESRRVIWCQILSRPSRFAHHPVETLRLLSCVMLLRESATTANLVPGREVSNSLSLSTQRRKIKQFE